MMRFGGEAELTLTDEQKQRLPFLYKENELGAEWFQKMRQNPTPEYTQAMNALDATVIKGDPWFERATEEQKNAFREASMSEGMLLWNGLQNDVQETLTPEQMLKVRQLEMQLMPALGIPFPSMYEPLGLTDEQKKEMNKITDELKAEFDRLTMEQAAWKAEQIVALYKTFEGKTFTKREDFDKARNEAFRKRVPSEEQRKKANELHEQGTKLMSQLQTRLMNVLTDDQLMKMQKIMDDTPEFAKKLLVEFKKMREATKKSPDYVPGPDSWRPGDPLPAQFKEERQRSRFPRSE
jgi:Spy/CpxP family protein refolding chaperone/predicted peroxiredoxin